MKDSDEVVERAVVGPLLVVVVQLVELRGDEPHGNRGEEEQVLGADREVVVRAFPRAEDQRCREKRECDARRIGDPQRAAHEPTPGVQRSRRRRLLLGADRCR